MGGAVFEALATEPGIHKLSCRLESIQPRSLDDDIVIHCAGALRHRTCDLRQCNVEGMHHLLNGLKPGCRVVYVSSKSVYAASSSKSLTEHDRVEPFDDYGISKRQAEKILMESGHPYLILRSSTLFGLGADHPGITFPSKAIQNFLDRQDVVLHEPDVIHDYLYVRDLASLIADLIHVESCWDGIFNIAGPPRSLHGLVFTMAKHIETSCHFRPVIQLLQKSSPWVNLLDCSKLGRLCGKIPYTDDQTVIAQLTTFFLRNRHNPSAPRRNWN